MTSNRQPIFIRIFKGDQLVEVKQFAVKSQIVFGREGEVDVRLDDPGISTIHAMLEERGEGQFHLCDLGSQSGTHYKGAKVVDTKIQSGDSFNVGGLRIEFNVGVPKVKSTTSSEASAPKTSTKQEPARPLPKSQPQPVRHAGSSGAGMATVARTSVKPLKGTFAPRSSAKISENLKPTKGSVVEIVLTWHDRIVNTYHFSKGGMINVGSHPKNEIILPVFGSVRQSHPIVKIAGIATVLLTADMTGELIREDRTLSFEDLKRQGTMTASGAGHSYALQQGEVIKISFGQGVALIIRYVAAAPETRIAPWIDISVNQLTALILGLMATSLFLFYAFLYAPPPLEEILEKAKEEPRKAQFFYKREKVDLSEQTPPAPQTVPKTAQEPIKDKEVAPARGEEGASRDAKPNKSESTKKIPTTDKAGKDKGIQPIPGKTKSDSAPKTEAKDVTKTGVLSVFGTKGVQDQLNKAFQGSGAVAGLSKSATGEAAEAAGSGTTPGAGLRETGAGGQGTATVGISGVTTKGRGGGLSGYGTGSLGAKKNATILAGGEEMTATGTIDKEAIRRVVQSNLGQIRSCYEKGLNKNPSLYGKVTIKWSIGPGGNVISAGVGATTMNAPEVENCLVARLRTWKFPEPPPGTVADVAYPFVFQAQE
ncbi:MAG: FHA domain-containing protein [Oligoflexia bacterium]|nr:FHA domain-containing protein [Oligoflexia bacterium]